MRAYSLLSSFIALSACGGPPGPLWEKSESKTTERLTALYGFAPNDVWAAGINGTVLHFDGTQWTAVPSGTSGDLEAIWGLTPNDVWFVGQKGTVLRWNGTNLSAVSGAANVGFKAVRGSAANTVFLCSTSGVYFFDGTFHEFTRGAEHVECSSLFSLGGTTVGALVRKSGTSSGEVITLSSSGGQVYPQAGTLNDFRRTVVGVTPTDLWVLALNMPIVRIGMGAPRELREPKNAAEYRPSSTTGWANAPNDVWVAGHKGMISHFDGAELTLSALGDSSSPSIHALWGTPGVTWAAGDEGWLLRRVAVTP